MLSYSKLTTQSYVQTKENASEMQEVQECTTVLFHRKKTKKKYQKSKENMLLKTYFCYI